jgi:hypothetical protein
MEESVGPTDEGLGSLVGDVVCDWTGVVYSGEVSEYPERSEGGRTTVLSLLMDVFITRRASKVEVKGSLASSSPA